MPEPMPTAMNPQESLRLIDETIREAKRSFLRIHFYFLVWGLLFALAGVLSFTLMQAGSPWHWVGWPAAGIIGGITAGVHGARAGRAQGVVTAMDRLHQWLWTCYTITLLLAIVGSFMVRTDPNPWVMLLSGLPTFVTGAMMRFRPLMVGGLVFWLLGILAFYAGAPFSSLLFGVAMVLGYVVPGLMLKKQEHGLRTA